MDNINNHITDTIDPRILLRGLQRLQSLVRGNGFDIKNIIIDSNSVKTLRFKARTIIKLSTEHGVKVVAGRNTSAELLASEDEFKRTLNNMVHDIIKSSEKRKQIIDVISVRKDKGFGTNDEKFNFQSLRRILVWYEKCQSCNGMGKNNCVRCLGHRFINCVHCQSRRQVLCPNCRGSTYIQTANGPQKCVNCHGDGFISCPKCMARGKVKCPSCKGGGNINCGNCAATGILSHLADVKVVAQIKFVFDDAKLPVFLTESLRNSPVKLFERHDIEIFQDPEFAPVVTTQINEKTEKKVEDNIVINFNVTCPMGDISFKLGDKVLNGTLFGYQSRLVDMPPFLDYLTKKGQMAFFAASVKGADVRSVMPKVMQFSMLSEILLKVLLLKDNKKAASQLFEKYGVGMGRDKINKLVKCADTIISNVTRRARYLGIIIGTFVYSVLLFLLLFFGHAYFSVTVFRVLLILFPLIGIVVAVGAARFGGLLVQYKQFAGVIDVKILRNNTPPIGDALWWAVSVIFIISIVMGFLFWETLKINIMFDN